MNLKELQVFIFDLDGVIYIGNALIPGAREVLEKLTSLKKAIFYLTNNATQTRAKFAEKLRKMGIPARAEQIVTSAYTTAQILRKDYPKASAYIIGEEGLVSEFKEAGFRIVSEEEKGIPIDLVIVGLDRNLTYQKLATALKAIIKGTKYIATNVDPTLPTEQGLLPGAGCMVAALNAAGCGGPEMIIGKPNPYMIEFILTKSKQPSTAAVIIGDRYTTDVQAGINAKIRTILVKTGTGSEELQKIPPSGPNPDIILESVANLLDYL
ncbi:MAG: HAD-IIA family hydrolase [Candidatus Helarchaeota archaeon]|nr:HAD-IIA family hydrolase [Candidatus Helarchaeota archaeon]